MKREIVLSGLIMMCADIFALDGYQIVKQMKEIPEPENSSVNAVLTIHSKKGNERVRQILMKTKDFGEVKKEVIVFKTPKDVEGVGYLMFDYPEDASGNKKDSDNWLYMPAMKKTRRIAASGTDSESQFMGTDFTYEDIGERALSKDDYKLLGEETAGGVLCYKVECVSKSGKEKDPRRIVYCGKEDFLLRKCEFFDKQNALHRVLTASDVQTIKGYKVTLVMKMENVQTETWSKIEMKDVVYDNASIDDNIFTVASLERENIR